MRKESDYTHHPDKKEEPIKLEGTFLYFDQKNLNNRVYSKKTAEEIIEQFNKNKEEGRNFGELGYPKENFEEINLKNISHEVEEIHINEDEQSIEGTIKILDTPSGDIVKSMVEKIKEGQSIGLSCRPRGYGTVDGEGNVVDFKIVSFDLVAGEDAFANIKEDDHVKPKK